MSVAVINVKMVVLALMLSTAIHVAVLLDTREQPAKQVFCDSHLIMCIIIN